jgi:hypothetical protein
MVTTMDGADKVISALETIVDMVPYMLDVMLAGMEVGPIASELVVESDSKYKIIKID